LAVSVTVKKNGECLGCPTTTELWAHTDINGLSAVVNIEIR